MIHPYLKRVPNPQGPWSTPDLCKAYKWPKAAPGRGIIGILECGGGWLQSDIDQAFRGMGLLSPEVTNISVDGTTWEMGTDADGEVALDIQVSAASFSMATNAAAKINMYYGQNFAAIVAKAHADGCGVLSISWGDTETAWAQADLQAMTIACQTATEAGMIILAASGDNDSDDGASAPSVDFPASSPFVLGCGGTMKPQNGEETVWNNNPGHADGEGTGGGYSVLYPVQPWQLGALAGRGRMVPDVSGNADPNTGYRIIINGREEIIGGTSAVAPLWAGLLLGSGQKGYFGPLAFKNPKWFTDITLGNNGSYKAAIGPDACTGMGSPIGNCFVVGG
jgi:kumamolisin